MEVDTTEQTGQAQSRGVALRISQVVSACTFCKSRKIKCDGFGPACGCCVKFGRAASCSLADTAARHSHDYVTHLQNRIRRLREISEAGKIRPAEGLHGRSDSAQPTEKAAAAITAFDFNAGRSQDSEPRHGRSGQQLERPEPEEPPLRRQPPPPPPHTAPPRLSAIDSLIADIGALPIPTSRNYSGPSAACSNNGPTLSTVLLAAAGRLPLLSMQQQFDAGSDRLCPTSGLAYLPEESAARKLAQHYLEHVYPRLPFFSIQGFWAQFNHVYGSNKTSSIHNDTEYSVATKPADISSTGAGKLNSGYSYFTVLLVLAIAASSLSRSADSMISNQARRLFQAGLQFRESAILPNTVVGVQSLLFLIQFATLNPSVLDSWYLIGVGMRNCVDLGLHQDPQLPLDASMTPSLLETRRRLWWSMYSFDRSMSIGCGRPTEIADSLIHVELPSFRIESAASRVEIEGYVQRYRALQLQSEIYDALNQSPGSSQHAPEIVVADLLSQLDIWQDANLPERSSQTLVDSEWLMGKMLLFRPCRLIPERSKSELGELWVSACRFTSLYRQLVESNGIFYVQVACEKVFWTGLVILYSYWRLSTFSETPAQSTQDGREGGLQALDLWKATKDVTFILQTLSERWEDGKILSVKFDSASARVIELLDEKEKTWQSNRHLEKLLPSEVVTLGTYVSLVSIWASGEEHQHSGVGGTTHNEELQDLVATMI